MSIPNIVEYCDRLFQSRCVGYAARSVHASSIGFPCARSLTYDQIVPGEAHDVGSEYVFSLGRLLEDQAIVDFTEAVRGTDIDIIRDRMPMPPNRYGIGGRVDWWIAFDPPGEKRRKVPAEFKTVSPFAYDDLHTIDDFLNSRSPWIRKYPGQLLTYMMLSNETEGCFIIRNKLNGRYRQIDVALTDTALIYCEELFKRAETVTAGVAAWRASTTDADRETAMPPRIPFDPKVCENCRHFKRCIPDVTKAPGVVLLCDVEVEAWLNIMDLERPHIAAYNEADEKIKQHVEAMTFDCEKKGDKRTFATEGHFITVTVGERTQYDIPDDIKAKYATKVRSTRKTIQRIGTQETEQ